jgi:hypothetical protein
MNLQAAGRTYVDGVVGKVAMAAVGTAERRVSAFLQWLREEGEAYERTLLAEIRRKFWKGLVHCCDNSRPFARTFFDRASV